MPKRRMLALTEAQRQEFCEVWDRHRKGHMREKAAILLKIADGISPHMAAQGDGLKAHHPGTIYKWMTWYENEGVERLEVQPGRGQKPAFSP